jgi:Tfp pilus assembly protein PilO
MLNLSTISTFLAPWKLYIYVFLATLAVGAFFGYGYTQRLKGAAECEEQYAQAQADYQQKTRKEERKRAEQAIKEESKVSKQLSDLKSEKGKVEDEARKLAREANRPGSCQLSTDELRYYEEAVRSTE